MFESVEFGSVRTVLVTGEVMFVAMDIAKILDYSETEKMTRRLDDDEVYKIASPELGGTNSMAREMTVINESGLYNAIIGSKKPEAKAFKKWVTSEVLPSIRKNGGYIQKQEEMTPEEIVASALIVAKNIIENQQKALDEAIKTKAYINNKKTAKAMNTASQKSKEVKRLEVQLDSSKEYSTIRKMEILTGAKYNWRELKKESIALDHPIHEVPDELYGSVKSYHKEVWFNCYGVDLSEY